MAQLICEDLTLGYEGQEILSHLSFSVEKGDYLCIIGENGSGKTTLMKTILGLRKPMKGSVTTGDGLSRREIGYLPQQSTIQRDFPASVREIVLSAFRDNAVCARFITGKKSGRRTKIWNGWALPTRKNAATASFPADSSSVCCLRAHFAPRKKCSCSTSLSPVLTPR